MSDDVGPWVRGRALARRGSTGLFVATDRLTGRAASIRAMLAGIADERDARAELSREAAVLASIGPHEAILALGSDESAASPPRLVLEGGALVPLADMLSASPLGLEVALAVVLPIADALAVAHASGIAHGRLSPSCVLVSARGTPKLAMFGDATASELNGVARRDAAFDDPSWLAPEVLMGEPATPASDVHALACLFVEIAAGRHPFAGAQKESDDGGRLGFAASLSRVRDLLGPLLPAGAAAAFIRALSKHPGDRQRDAAELSADIARYVPAAKVRRPLVELLGSRAGSPIPRRVGVHQEEAQPRVSSLPFVAIAAALLIASTTLAISTSDVRSQERAASAAAGRIRILARPWANVSLDGVLLDTTPIGSPVPVTPGRHVVDFVHPSAPKIQRVIEVSPGQTVVVDVILDVPPPAAPSAKVDDSP